MKILSAFLILALFGCQQSHTNDEVTKSPKSLNTQSELESIENTRANFTKAIKEGKYQDLSKWVAKDAQTRRPGSSGWDNMFELGKERGRFPYDSIIMKPTETFIMNDSMAYDWGASRTYYTNENGEQVELRNSFLVILKKEDGIWKLYREVGSSYVE